MQVHASCAERDGAGVLLLGPPGCGKSDLVLRLVDRGFSLVADDRVVLDGLTASAPLALAGLLEIRALGLLRMRFAPSATLALAVMLRRGERLPVPARYEFADVPMISVDPWPASAPILVALALDAVLGRAVLQDGGAFVAGAFE
jgi:HPr kinase/phosphorylase